VAKPDHNPRRRRLHLPIVGVTSGVTNDARSRGPDGGPGPKPPWLKVRLATGPNVAELRGLMRGLDLHTVCEEAMCPNLGECWDAREATFLLLGSRCTRRCGFCDVMTAKPDAPDPDEPQRIAEAVRAMGLRHVVVTGVARDDLPDGGAAIWAQTIRAVRRSTPDCRIEVLPSDFKGGAHDIATVISAGPDVFAHNLETVRRLHATIRPAFGYDRSLDVLRIAKGTRPGQVTKSNLILGMGERPDEVAEALRDIADAGVNVVTIGQYLRPTPYHLPVDRWVAPEEFDAHAHAGEGMGLHVEAGPLVRSSYHAGEQFRRAMAGANAHA
jgi:lipoyl synthase